MQEKIWVSREPMPARAKVFCALLLLGLILISFYAGWRLGTVAQESAPRAPLSAESRVDEIPVELVAWKAPAPPKHEYPPGYNFALYTNGASIKGGTNPVLIIDGNSENFDQYHGYAYTMMNRPRPDPFVITLKGTVTIDFIRFRLWDQDERFHRYRIDVCADAEGQKWITVADRTGENEECRSWQFNEFKAQHVRLIRVTGTFNSANASFCIVELEALRGRLAEHITTKEFNF